MITTKHLADKMQESAPPFTREHQEGAYYALRGLLLSSLSAQEVQVFGFCAGDRGSVTAREIADYLSISIQQASTTLKRMADYGLLDRCEMSSKEGLRFDYRLKP